MHIKYAHSSVTALNAWRAPLILGKLTVDHHRSSSTVREKERTIQ